MASTVMEGRKRPGKRLARLAHKLRHVVTKLAPEVGPLMREASDQAGRLVREACLLGCRGNKEEESEAETSRVSWCTLAYWEERTRVGRLFPVHTPGVEVFAVQPKPPPIGDALSLAQLAPANHKPSESTLRTREKIGLGLILSHDEDGVWAYNRTEVPIFVNSPTLDLPNSRTFSVFKIPPGYTLQIFSWSVARHYARIRDPLLQDGPFDPHAVRLSFAKGWGSKYSRQSVDCCPCWIEVLLRPPQR